ncbi:RNA-directed DNA polymerase from mobile element jockey [Frankliniella fusca]|uniref:RNA-directed DNA polymerase from mobile element jockey n=1 Tax=Frankliniella fusca TaxID=407009 RepID=A0AAE1LLP6_9NEOP|nr:RNA-directed DNA polymerase from mobile element jockey [Frankliniella fusca]
MQECTEDHTRVWKIGRALKGFSGTVKPLTTPAGTATSAEARAEAISEHFERVHTANDHMAVPQHTQQVERDLALYMDNAKDTTPVRLATPREWRLRINNSKTEPILFSKRRVTEEEKHHLRIDGAPLPWKESVRFLGVHLDRRLNLRAHLTAIKKSARAAMSVLYPLINRRSQLSTNMKVRMANAYIRPILTYAAPAWAGMLADTNLHSLQIIQNKYLRLALNTPRYTPTRQLHIQAQTTHIGDFIVKTLRSFYAKAATNNNPLIAGLGQYTPENIPHRLKHNTPLHRLFQLDQ